MTWVTLPIPEHNRSREQQAAMRLVDGDECRLKLADGSEVEGEWSEKHRCWRDEDGEPIEDVSAVWVRPAGGASGAGGKTELVRLPPVYVTPQERERYMALAASRGESVSTWARRKLAT